MVRPIFIQCLLNYAFNLLAKTPQLIPGREERNNKSKYRGLLSDLCIIEGWGNWSGSHCKTKHGWRFKQRRYRGGKKKLNLIKHFYCSTKSNTTVQVSTCTTLILQRRGRSCSLIKVSAATLGKHPAKKLSFTSLSLWDEGSFSSYFLGFFPQPELN